jgi:hypothetical protein
LYHHHLSSCPALTPYLSLHSGHSSTFTGKANTFSGGKVKVTDPAILFRTTNLYTLNTHGQWYIILEIHKDPGKRRKG